MILREGLRETVELVLPQEPQLQRPTRSYDLVSNPNLRAYLKRCEEGIQSYNTWPVRSSRVPRIFEHFIGSDSTAWNILNILRNNGIIEFTIEEVRRRNFYSLDPDNLRAFFAFWWTLRQDRGLGKPLRLRSLVEMRRRVKGTQEALGLDPLREVLHEPLPNNPNKPGNKLMTTEDANKQPVIKPPLFLHNSGVEDGEPKGEKPRDAEEVLVESIEAKIKERPVPGKIPFIEKEELRRASFWTRGKLEVLLAAIPKDVTEEVSYPRIPPLQDDQGVYHRFNNPEAKMVMFISVAVAADKEELKKFNSLLEDLNYWQLRLGLKRCIVVLQNRPDLGKNLAELFQSVKKQVERDRAAW